MEPCSPTPVKLIIGVLYSDEGLFAEAEQRLIERYGALDFKSQVFPFEVSDYYVPEMGASIQRLFLSFVRLISPGDLAAVKIRCNGVENELAVSGRRRVNLDPGYMDYDKVVLASAKYNAHKIYLSDGIYADLTLRYQKGRFHPSPYCFPDFKSGEYDKVMNHIRALYKGQVRKHLGGGKGGAGTPMK